MTIRFIQPFILSGLILVYSIISKDYIYIVITVLVILSLAGYLVYKHYADKRHINDTQLKVMPAMEIEEDEGDLALQIMLDEDSKAIGLHDSLSVSTDYFEGKSATSDSHSKIGSSTIKENHPNDHFNDMASILSSSSESSGED
jgi:hypothetical protein